MLEKIRLKRFQNHEDTTIVFDQRLTTIVGASDEGKSAILRALSFVCLNKPSGMGFVKDNCKSATVTIFVDSRRISRRRGKGANTYTLDGKRFNAFRNRVPEEIERVTNLGEVNFQRQLDLPYWFTESPGKVSKNLNSIINLQIIDQTIAKVAQELRSARSRLEATKERLADAKKDKEELSFVPELLTEWKELNDLRTEKQEIAQNALNLGNLVRGGQILTQKLDRANLALLDAKKVITLGKQWAGKRKELDELDSLLKQIRKLTKPVNTPVPDLRALLALRKHGDEVAEDGRNLEYLIQDIHREQKEYDLCERHLKTLEKTLNEKLSNLKTCPMCGSQMQKSKRLSYPICTSLSHQSQEQKKGKSGSK